MSSISIDGYDVHAATVQIPSWGAWWIEVATPDALVLDPGQSVTCQVSNVEMRGTIKSGGAVDGRAAYRIVGGGGGWHKDLPAKSYHKSPSVRVSEVLADAAAEVGETLGPVPGNTLGEHFAREAGPAHRVLNGLAPRAWYIDALGNTQFGSRPAADYTGDGAIVRRDRARGIVEVDTDDLSQLVPGVQIDGQQPATDVEITLRGDKLTARVYCGAPTSRRLAAYAQIFDALDPFRRFRGTFEYRVVFQTGERFDLQIVRTAAGLDDLEGVPVRPGTAGMRGNVTLGELVLVTFVDGDPSRPAIFAHSAPDDPGWMPLTIELGGPGALSVVRVGDPVQCGPFSGAPLAGSLRVKAVV